MLKISRCLTPVFVLVFAAQGFGQCDSSRRHSSHFVTPVRTQPIPKVSASVPTRPSPAPRQAAPVVAPAATPVKSPVAETDKFAGIVARRPAEIRSVANGDLLRIALDTQKKPKGMAILSVGGVSLLIEPQQWTADSVLLQLPQVLLKDPQPARLFIAATPEDLLLRIDIQITP